MIAFKNTFTDLCEVLKEKVSEVLFIDLWHNQINFLDDEYAFPFPAVFIEMVADNAEPLGAKARSIATMLNVYFAYETLADSYHESQNQEVALAYFDIMQKIDIALQTSVSENYSQITWLSAAPIEAPGSIILYRISYRTNMYDNPIKDSIETQKIEVGYELKDEKEPFTPSNTFTVETF
jgi:hypothetical protein